MANTPKNDLQEWAASQSQPWVAVNQAMHDLDQLITGSVISMALTDPPGLPNEGDAYIPATTATGDWIGQENKLAYYINGAWRFKSLAPGQFIYNEADSSAYVWNGTSFPGISGTFDPANYVSTAGGTLSGDLIVSRSGNPSLTLETTFTSGREATINLTGAKTSLGSGIGRIRFHDNQSGTPILVSELVAGNDGDIDVSIGNFKQSGHQVYHQGNITYGTAAPTGTPTDGDIYLQHDP